MARKEKDHGIDHPEEPDLAPFMNLVIILIPLLLLSVVLIEVSVINVTMPLEGEATEDEEDDEEALDLTINLDPEGFYIYAVGDRQEPIDGCAPDGPTICLEDESVDVERKFRDAREQIRAGGTDEARQEGEAMLEEALLAYNWRELYNMLVEFKDRFPDESSVKLTAVEDLPFALTVRTMDVARHRLEEDSYDSNEEFWEAEYATEPAEDGDEEVYKNLFGEPAFAVQM